MIGQVPQRCQRVGCSKHLHNICSTQWADKNNLPKGGITQVCRAHHPQYQKFVAAANAKEDTATAANATHNQSSTEIAAAVAAALVAAGISVKGKKNAAAKVSEKGKKGARGTNFSPEEVDCMLELIEKHMPLSASQWQKVVDEHMMRFPTTDRDIDGLRRKFNALASKKIPTGDPFIPPDVKKAKKIRNDLSKFSGLKTGSPEKMEINFNTINSKGGALEDDFSSTRDEEFKDSVEFVGSDSEDDGDNNKDDDDEDDGSKNVARSNLRNMAKGTTSSTTTPTSRMTSTHPLVTREFSSTTFSKRRDKNKSNKKRRVDDDDDDDDDDTMKTFMKMFMMQSERERMDREADREERRLQMAQAKATSDMMQLLLMRSMGMINTAAGSMGTTASASTDDSGANEKSGVEED